MGPDTAHVRLRAADLGRNANLTNIRPGAIRKLHRTTLVVTVETLPVRAIGAEREPESIVENTGIDISLDLAAPSLLIRTHAMETIGEKIPIGAEDHHGRKPDVSSQQLHVLVHESVVEGGANLRAGVSDQAVDRNRLAHGNARREVGRKPRSRFRIFRINRA